MKNFYNLKEIEKKNALYNIIIGERSNGKTYACLYKIVKNFIEKGEQGALVRRWQDDFIGKRGQAMFQSLVDNDVVSKLTKGEWTNIYYYASKWYLSRFEDGKKIMAEEPLCFGFALSSMEHDKSTSYNGITTIVFDEFLTRQVYITDEFVLFCNVCSTIIRHRNNVKIYMLGNTVNKYCPYFSEMGLTHIKEQKQGTIDLYRYGESGLTVAVEYCKPFAKGKDSDIYFAFENPKLSMITGGQWELDIYPHLPFKYQPKDILLIYFILFDDIILQCEIVEKEGDTFTFIHEKTTPLKDTENDIIFSLGYSPKLNYKRNIMKPQTNIDKKIAWYFLTGRVFYQNNEVGEVVNNYLKQC